MERLCLVSQFCLDLRADGAEADPHPGASGGE
jgi:hypothetical protein